MNPLNINKIKKLSQNCDAINTVKPQSYNKVQKDKFYHPFWTWCTVRQTLHIPRALETDPHSYTPKIYPPPQGIVSRKSKRLLRDGFVSLKLDVLQLRRFRTSVGGVGEGGVFCLCWACHGIGCDTGLLVMECWRREFKSSQGLGT